MPGLLRRELKKVWALIAMNGTGAVDPGAKPDEEIAPSPSGSRDRTDRRKEPEMPEDSRDGGFPVKEYEERTLNMARLFSLLRQECGMEDPWHAMVLSLCSFERMHLKDGWEFVLTNRKDIEEVGLLFERSNSPQEFREGMLKLKEQDLRERLKRENLADDP